MDFAPLLDEGLFRPPGAVPYSELILRTPKLKVTDAEGQVVFRGRRTVPLGFSMYPREKEFYEAVEDYIRTGYNSLERIEDPTHRRAVGFILTTFQRLNASSVRAIKYALEGRLNRLQDKVEKLPPEEEEEDPENRHERYQGELDEKEVFQSDRQILQDEITILKKVLAIPVEREKKIDRFRDLLRQIDQETPGAKVLVFTEYRRTPEFLRERLERWYGTNTVVLINGDMELEGKTPEAESKRRSQRLFRDDPEIRFLVSTEAGGEGINLQFCYIVVNYDWIEPISSPRSGWKHEFPSGTGRRMWSCWVWRRWQRCRRSSRESNRGKRHTAERSPVVVDCVPKSPLGARLLTDRLQ